ncbi:tumor necrosis factor ligand superfamily member 14 isoform X2 [Perca flavescens]|nr:tumor necrosis factor ligand superfamily member 14-like isoform X2 [Perca flavescens]
MVGLALFGLVVEGCLIYSLYKKTQNMSNSQTSGQQGGTIMTRVGSKESNEIPTVRPHLEQVQQRPFAQLIGSNNPKGLDNVVQWEHKNGETITYNMGYENGRLLVEKDGYYYLYSKVKLDVIEECFLIQHKVMKDTTAYDESIELMQSKSFRCRTQKPLTAKASGGEDLWNSFLAGIFHLRSGDKIFVTLNNIDKIRTGPAENLMGAFMIFPGNMQQ